MSHGKQPGFLNLEPGLLLCNMPYSPSLEDYLKTIYLLNKNEGSVRLVDIADRMSVTKPSANRAVAQLAKKDLVEHIRFGPILLTDKGMETSEKLISRFDTVKRFLMLVLNLSEDMASSEACVIEHTICDVTLEKMASLNRRGVDMGIILTQNI